MSKLREGFHTVTPYLVSADAPALIRFLERVFDAVETERATAPDGAIMHAEARIGDSMVMIGQANDTWKARPATCYLYLELDNVDAVYRRGIDAGARSLREPADQSYGERSGGFEDAWGNHWWIGAPLEKAG